MWLYKSRALGPVPHYVSQRLFLLGTPAPVLSLCLLLFSLSSSREAKGRRAKHKTGPSQCRVGGVRCLGIAVWLQTHYSE